ncbi:hypothetical protein KBZ14_15275 [Synechococcus sp. HJ21-Hayes]|jgi:hypothetical protein|uniref:leucine zipper domain-containing protein n=1 Tax=unclassified Synechococcus TaxID=2626047 RepID=UPI0020CD2112|nr:MULTISPECIES: leucine zipper domain-containing protein [unclassified Synechococcus]MCP9832590.1 hypothetical protein [Synechococcus sp. JJ3a-Johnson]MCP9854220.1 hypothetical protein [Synechococcus sp. HJ21-Hayes]
MHSHPNARLTQKSRIRLINQHLQDRRPLAELAAEAGISLQVKKTDRYRGVNRIRLDKAAKIL